MGTLFFNKQLAFFSLSSTSTNLLLVERDCWNPFSLEETLIPESFSPKLVSKPRQVHNKEGKTSAKLGRRKRGIDTLANDTSLTSFLHHHLLKPFLQLQKQPEALSWSDL